MHAATNLAILTVLLSLFLTLTFGTVPKMSSPPKPLRIGFTIFPEAMSLDFIGPLDILSTLSRDDPARPASIPHVDCVILGDKLEPVRMSNGMSVMPQLSYAEAAAQEWDAVLVPGGIGARPWFESNAACRDFLVKVVPKCRYVFTVCTGSWLLSATGLLRGEKATCNKRAFKSVLEQSKDSGVIWVPKARWVVSGKFWTSSGITAGIDMAAAFVRYWVELHLDPSEGEGEGKGKKAKEVSDAILGVAEVTSAQQDDDPWAEYYDLV